MPRRLVSIVTAAVVFGLLLPLSAQRGGMFTARLSWVPIAGSERNDVAGTGAATGTLTGSTLGIAGSFEGLPAAATAARLHQGVAKGARGPAIGDLTISRSASGTIKGTAELTAGQIDALRAGRLYVQVHAERGVAPDNAVLWGWLLP